MQCANRKFADELAELTNYIFQSTHQAPLSQWKFNFFQKGTNKEEEEEEEEPLLIYNTQGSPFRCKKLSVINGSPEHNNVLKL